MMCRNCDGADYRAPIRHLARAHHLAFTLLTLSFAVMSSCVLKLAKEERECQNWPSTSLWPSHSTIKLPERGYLYYGLHAWLRRFGHDIHTHPS